MNNRKFKFAVMTMSVVVTAGSGRAIAEDKPATKQAKADANGVKPEDGPRVALRIDNAHRLRVMMEEKIKLSPQQAAAINRVLDDYVDDLRNNFQRPKAGVPRRAGNKVLPPTIAQMEREKVTAEAIGDQNRIKELNQEISNRRREPMLPGDDHADSLRAKIVPHLKDDQVAVFDKVMERWHLIIPKGPRTGPFQRFRRALQDPEVGISAERREAFDEILKVALKAGRTGKEGSRAKLEQEVERAKSTIYAKLDAEQRKKIDANLRLFEEIEKQYDDSIDRARAKGVSKRKPDRTRDDGAEPVGTAEPDKADSKATEKPAAPQP